MEPVISASILWEAGHRTELRSCVVESSIPRLTIASKLQEKLPLVTTMRQVPNLSSQIMPVGSGHDEVFFLKGSYSGQKSGFNARIRPLLATICKQISCLAWSDPILHPQLTLNNPPTVSYLVMDVPIAPLCPLPPIPCVKLRVSITLLKLGLGLCIAFHKFFFFEWNLRFNSVFTAFKSCGPLANES